MQKKNTYNIVKRIICGLLALALLGILIFSFVQSRPQGGLHILYALALCVAGDALFNRAAKKPAMAKWGKLGGLLLYLLGTASLVAGIVFSFTA